MRKILQVYIDPAVKEYLVELMAEIVRNEIAGQTSYERALDLPPGTASLTEQIGDVKVVVRPDIVDTRF